MERVKPHLRQFLWRCLLCAALCALLCGTAFAMEGTGTEAEPYVISTAEDLAAMHEDLAGHYVLGCDIDLTGYTHTPVGSEEEGPFTGSFDGQGHTLSNLVIRDMSKYVGLFGYLEGSVSNLSIRDCSVEGARYVGAVAGYASETASLANCHVLSGQIDYDEPLMPAYIGGIIGCCYGEMNGTFSNGADLNCSAGYVNEYIGGLAGYIDHKNTTWLNCINTGKIEITACVLYPTRVAYFVGGLVGYLTGGDATLLECSNEGSIINNTTSNSTYSSDHLNCRTGGICGYIYSAKIQECINKADIISSYPSGYLAGMAGQISACVVEKCVNDGNISGKQYNGGIAAASYNSTIIECYNYGDMEYTSYYVSGIVSYGAGTTFDSCKNYGYSKCGILGYETYSNSANHCTIKDCEDNGYSVGGMVASSVAGNYGVIFQGMSVVRGDVDSRHLYENTRYQNYLYWFSSYLSNGKRMPWIFIPNHLQIDVFSRRINVFDGAWYYCSDLRYNSKNAGYTPLSFQELQNPTLYQNLEDGWTIEAGKNSGLPFPEDFREDFLNESVLFLTPGETVQLEAAFSVDHWTAFDETVATCENGLVTAVAPGSAGVSAYSSDGGHRGNCIVFVYDPKEQMTVTAASTALVKGGTTQMTSDLYDVYENDPQGILWSSSNPAIATVDKVTGLVTAVGGGEVVITGYAPLSDISASCTLTVTAPITALTLPTTATINAGVPTKLSYTVTPATFTGTLTWTSTDESVVTVEDGVVTGHAPGMAIVTAASDTGLESSCTVTVKQPSTGLSLSCSELTLEVGFTQELIAFLEPADSTDAVTWTSSNTAVAAVSGGVVTAKAAGQTLITAATTSGQKAYCTVTVVKAAVLPTSITLNQANWRANVGEKLQLTATVLPSTATDQRVTWTSSAPEVASVSSTGVVTAVSPGQAVITAATHNGFFAECEVKVAVTSSAAFTLADSRGTIGKTVEIPVYIDRNPGIAAFTVTLDYDAAVMTPVSVTAGDLLSGGTFATNLSDEARTALHLTWYAAEDLTEDGLAFTVTMQIADTAAVGTCQVSLSYEADDICNRDKAAVRFAVEPSNVKVIDYLVGDVCMDGKIGMKDLVLLCQYFNEMTELTEAQLLAADVYYDDTVDVKDLVQLAQILTQQPPEPAVQAMAVTQDVFLSEALGGKVKVEATAPDLNGNVVITVSASDCAELAAFRFALDYDMACLEIESIVQGNALTQGTFQSQYDEDSVPVILWYDASAHSVEGTLFTVYAKMKDGADYGDYPVDLLWDADDICTEDLTNLSIEVNNSAIHFVPMVHVSGAALHTTGEQLDIQLTFESNAQDRYTAVAVLGFYENGKMVQTRILPIEIYGSQATLSLVMDQTFTQCKLFLLDDVHKLNPIASAVVIPS